MNPTSEVNRLRDEHYNSTVSQLVLVHDDLLIMRVRPDAGVPSFLPGQFTVLGLGAWEPRAADAASVAANSIAANTMQGVAAADPARNLVKRPYSISCSLVDDRGRLVRASDTPYLEFYIVRIRRDDPRGLALTPRLFALQEGARLFCSSEIRGRYTLHPPSSQGNVILAATGTGEAPHNAMVAELLVTRFPGRIVSITCVRRKGDLGYAAAHRELERRFANYRYLTLTTRESENLDPKCPMFVGKRYLQDYFLSGDFERDANMKLSATDTHVYLCGSPQMIGQSRATSSSLPDAEQPAGMIDVLERRGFHLDRPDFPGNIHAEKYWFRQ